MGNLVNEIFYALGNTNGTSLYTTKNTITTSSSTSSTDFSHVLAQLNNNVDNAVRNSEINSFGYGTTTSQAEITLDIDSIIQQIKDNKSDTVDVDSEVKKYLLENFGDSAAEIIESLSGTQKLPTQIIAAQNQILQNVVSKIAAQVREKMYAEKSISDLAVFTDDSSDDSCSSSSSSSISPSASSNNAYLY